MKEIRILMQQLRNYPSNLFVFPSEEPTKETVDAPWDDSKWKYGLTVCDKDGKQQGFIETGTNDGKVIID